MDGLVERLKNGLYAQIPGALSKKAFEAYRAAAPLPPQRRAYLLAGILSSFYDLVSLGVVTIPALVVGYREDMHHADLLKILQTGYSDWPILATLGFASMSRAIIYDGLQSRVSSLQRLRLKSEAPPERERLTDYYFYSVRKNRRSPKT